MEKQKNSQNNRQQKKPYKSLKIKVDASKELGLNIPKENKYTIPIFIPHKGCDNECVFCNQKKISGQIKDATIEDARCKIEEYLSYYLNQIKDKKVEIAFFGGSFTGLKISEQESFLEVANEYINKGKVGTIRISTRPDYIDDNVLELLKKYNVETIELGVQSMSEDVLVASRRGHNAESVEQASKKIKEHGFKLGHQVMIGLPESTLEKELYTAKKSIEMEPDVVRIYPVYVLKESKLWNMLENGEYSEISLEDSVERTKQVYLEYVNNNINVIRVGLQVTEEINQKNVAIKGPVCDNYKERVLSRIMREGIEKEVLKKKRSITSKIMNKIYKKVQIIVKVPCEQVNYAIGNNRCNLKYFEDKYNMKFKIIKQKEDNK